MKLPHFEYAAPADLAEAAALLAEHSSDAKIIAGGQSLLPIMAYRLASPAMLVDIGRIPDLRTIRLDDDGIHLGPMVRWCDIERSEVIAQHQPLLKQAVSHVAHYQVRNRGTIGGSLALADPAAELPCVALTCGAILSIFSKSGTRMLAADAFFQGELETALRADEIIVDVHFPKWPKGRKWAFLEFSKRRGDFALAGVALYVDTDGEGIISDCAVGVLGVGGCATRLGEVEQMLVGQALTPAVIDAAGKLACAIIEPPEDIHASAAYRKSLVGTLVERALTAAIDRPSLERQQ